MTTVKDLFLDIIQYPTTSDENADTFPSTSTQNDFGQILAEKMQQIGLHAVQVDAYGYVTGYLPANTTQDCPVIGFIAHMDTSPDAKGEHISPQIIQNYDGTDIILNGITLSPKEFPDLLEYEGDTLITTDGTTLLGADDKAGIAEILNAMSYLIQHPEIPHGKICIAFTPDEEIGKGVDHFDTAAFGADFAYTIDGGKIGELEYENFNAAQAIFTIRGRSVHPGTAKNVMVNAALLACEIAEQLPKNETPATTESYAGFYHLCGIEGSVSEAKLTYIIRDFDAENFAARKDFLQNIASKYPDSVTLSITDQYYNMASKIADCMEIIDLAKQAMLACDIAPIIQPIRGGTDGARLSYMGLPCPNLFTGGHNFHGPYEYISVSSMEKAVQMIVKIAELACGVDFPKKI